MNIMMRFFIISMCLLLMGSQNFRVSAQREVKVTTLLSASDLSLDSVPTGVIPGLGLMGAFGGELATLDPDDTSRKVTVAIPDSIEIESFITAGKSIIMKTGSSVVWIDNDRQQFDGITFEDSDFNIIHASDTTFFLTRKTSGLLYEIGLASKITVDSWMFDEPPLAAYRLASGFLVVTLHNILLHDGAQWINVLHHPTEIQCCESTPYGIFFGTTDALWRLTSPGKTELVATGEASAIHYSGSSIYIIDSQSNLLRMDY